jgi:hypothetical protein
MWGWANHSLPAKATDQLYRVKRFGEREKLSQLTEATFVADEGLGWETAAVATRILEGKGVYRCPSKNGFLFLVFMDICFIDTDRSSESKRAKAREEIACASHTTGFETSVCEHLAQNPSQEWFSEAPTEASPWPDAWCEECNRAFEEEGEWNGQNERRMKIKLLCHRCYEFARAKGTFAN